MKTRATARTPIQRKVHNGICAYNGCYYLLCGDRVYPITSEGNRLTCVQRTPMILPCKKRSPV